MTPATIAAYITLCLVWGSTFLALRIAVHTIPPWILIACRSSIAGGMLTGIAVWRGEAWPRRANLASAAISGLLMFTTSQALLTWGETRLTSGTAAVLGCTVSLFTPIISWLSGASARPGPAAALGLLLGFVGVAVLVPPSRPDTDIVASALVLGSSIAWSFGAALARRVPPADTPLMGSGLQLLSGGLFSASFAAVRGEWAHLDPSQISVASLLALAYLIVMGSLVAFACFGWLVQIWRPERLTTYAYINPIIALSLGAALLGEPLGWRQFAATALILAAVALVMVPRRKA